MSETLKMILIFICGCWAGCICGVVVMCLLQINREPEDDNGHYIIGGDMCRDIEYTAIRNMPKPEDYEIFDNTWGDKK